MTEQIILASNSPRRKELLKQAGIPFVIDAEEVDETAEITEPCRLTLELSRRKAMAVVRRHPGQWVLGADTVVYYDGEILGKPADAQEAFDILCMLAGRKHEVITGVSLLRLEQVDSADGGTPVTGASEAERKDKERHQYFRLDEETAIHAVSFAEVTSVWMFDHHRDVIREYVATGEPLDKAGAYGIQGAGAILVERIEGDYYNVVGLPIGRLYQELSG